VLEALKYYFRLRPFESNHNDLKETILIFAVKNRCFEFIMPWLQEKKPLSACKNDCQSQRVFEEWSASNMMQTRPEAETDYTHDNIINWACEYGIASVVRFFMRSASNFEEMYSQDFEARWRLSESSWNEDLGTVRLEGLSNGIPPVASEFNFCQKAAACGHETVLHILFEKNSTSVAQHLDDRLGALYIAAMELDDSTIKVLLQYGADINGLVCGSLPLLHFAIATRQSRIVRFLLDHGADPNVRISDRGDQDPHVSGYLPLHTAARYGNVETAEILLDRGAPIDTTNDQGETALYVTRNPGMAWLLHNRGASMDAIGDRFAWYFSLLKDGVENKRYEMY
jgi:hypothetical protein